MPILVDPTQIVLIQGYLTGARDALHALMTGRQVKVVVDQNGERIEYTSATVGQLRLYIGQLERQLGIGAPRGPMRVFM